MDMYNGTIVPCNKRGWDNDVNRIYCLLRFFKMEKEFYIYCQCSNLDQNGMEDFSIQFMSMDHNPVVIEYDKELFDEIEETAYDSMHEWLVSNDSQHGAS